MRKTSSPYDKLLYSSDSLDIFLSIKSKLDTNGIAYEEGVNPKKIFSPSCTVSSSQESAALACPQNMRLLIPSTYPMLTTKPPNAYSYNFPSSTVSSSFSLSSEHFSPVCSPAPGRY